MATTGPDADPKCDVAALSGVPYNVFSGSAGSVFGKFYDAVGKAQQKGRLRTSFRMA